MITAELLEKARLYVRRWFARHMPAHMVFHDLEHTLTVTRSAVALARVIDLPKDEIALIEIAALFHDTGYANAYKGHEEESARIAAEFLRKQGAAEKDIKAVQKLIRATIYDAVPDTLAEKVMRDADSAKAGQADFSDKSELLRRELGSVRGSQVDAREWLLENVAYLKSHRFHTQLAEERYGTQKQINLQELERLAGSPESARNAIATHTDRSFDRDLSWLAFNDRVLQEARDRRVPLLERIKFLAIYSSNLDEFYRVRVASLRSLINLNKTYRTALDITPARLVDRINRKALEQQKRFGALYRGELMPALRENGIRILKSEELDRKQREFVERYFNERILPQLNTAIARPGNAPFIEDRKLYFSCTVRSESAAVPHTILVNIPSEELGRFLLLPSKKGNTDIMFLDDAVRSGLPGLFEGKDFLACHAIKLSRDAELYLDEEFTGNVKEKVKKSLKKRDTGVPSRFLYDSNMPPGMLARLQEVLGLKEQDMVPGGRYHNFSDLMHLPVPGHQRLRERNWPPLQHPALKEAADPFKAIGEGDILLHYPYHDFGMFVQLLRKAASDRKVDHIYITLYRVAQGSAVCAALVDALHNGKAVTVFVEVQARFDEGSNLFWGEMLEEAGARVIYSYEKLKVHCKLCMIERRERGRPRRYAYLGTGNFNERTSRIYSDLALLTADRAMCDEVAQVFAHLLDRDHRPALQQLLMAPINLRDRIEAMIDREITHAMSGRKAAITIKLNSLEDRSMIQKLYAAGRAGVSIKIIVRGICCLVPSAGTNIEAVSIVDRYLEHSRVYLFHNNGTPVMYLASADLMGRNLDRRIEVAFPINDAKLRDQVKHLLDLQWKDRVKARWIDEMQTNPYRTAYPGEKVLRSQEATYKYFRRLSKRK